MHRGCRFVSISPLPLCSTFEARKLDIWGSKARHLKLEGSKTGTWRPKLHMFFNNLFLIQKIQVSLSKSLTIFLDQHLQLSSVPFYSLSLSLSLSSLISPLFPTLSSLSPPPSLSLSLSLSPFLSPLSLSPQSGGSHSWCSSFFENPSVKN